MALSFGVSLADRIPANRPFGRAMRWLRQMAVGAYYWVLQVAA